MIVPVPGGLERYRPQLRNLVVDEGRYADSELAEQRNLTAALFRMENSRSPNDVQQVLVALTEWLDAPEQTSLRRAFIVWLKRVFLPGRMPNIVFPDLNELQEVQSMLSERVIEWTEQWKQECLEEGRQKGLQEGLQQGLQQGLHDGRASMLSLVLERRFGPLNEDQSARLRAADPETLLRWAELFLTAESVDDVLGR